VTNRMVRDSNHKKLEPKKPKSKGSNKLPEGSIEVTHTNAPLLTVKYLELVLKELRKFNETIAEEKAKNG